MGLLEYMNSPEWQAARHKAEADAVESMVRREVFDMWLEEFPFMKTVEHYEDHEDMSTRFLFTSDNPIFHNVEVKITMRDKEECQATIAFSLKDKYKDWRLSDWQKIAYWSGINLGNRVADKLRIEVAKRKGM